MGIRSPQASTSGAQDSDSDQEVIIKTPVQVPTSMCVPYIEGTKMNWTVDDGLYNRFAKWKLKCENIFRLQVGHVVRAKKVQEGGGMVWRLWHRPVYIFGFNTRTN